MLSRSRTRKTGNMSLASVTDEAEMGLELGDGARGVKSSAHAAHGGRRHGSVDARMLDKGIVVTNEVTVTYTQEERIERIIGF